jgi:hypothetical protein
MLLRERPLSDIACALLAMRTTARVDRIMVMPMQMGQAIGLGNAFVIMPVVVMMMEFPMLVIG